jgi:hypothetical protein
VQLTLEIAAPELQKAVQFGKVRGNIKLLPDIALQQIRVIRQMVDDLRGRQPPVAYRLPVVAHLRAPVPFVYRVQQACTFDYSLTIKNRVETID